MIAPLTFKNENAVIASLFDCPAHFAACSQSLIPDDFSDPSMRQAWEWMHAIFLKGRTPDMFTMHQTYGHQDQFPAIREAVSQCRTLYGECLHYAAILKDRARLRRAFLCMERGLEIAGGADSFDQVRPALEAALMSSFEDSNAGRDCSMSEAVAAVLEQMRNPEKQLRAFPTGFPKFDLMFRRTQAPTETNLIIIAGKSGEGKSSFALNVMAHAAERDIAGKIYSMEMDRNDLAIRAGLHFARDGSFETALQKAADLPIWISDRADITVESICSDIRLAVARFGIKIVIVDYLQLLGSAPSKENRERQVAAMSRMLKVAAMESKVLVYALSQLNDDGRLRESRAIEQDADAVVYVVAKGGSHYLWLAKNRRGPKHGEVKDIPDNIENQGIKMDFDSANFRFHPAP